MVKNVDGHDADAVAAAIKKAKNRKDQPSIICCKTIIGWGAPNKQGTKSAHGEALGPDEVANARKTLGWESPPFVVPEDIRAAWDHKEEGAAAEKKWLRVWRRYKREFPTEGAEFERRMKGDLPADWSEIVQSAIAAGAAVTGSQATRASSQAVLNVLGPKMPEMLGGSADLTGSVNTKRKDSVDLTTENFKGNYVYYGVREFGMTAIMNGLTVHGGYRPYGGTFLVFSDYARNAVRVAAIMHCPTTLVYTHDSIGLGEDGPTHQPIEHLAVLRAMPNLHIWRPCDAVESAVSWAAALERKNGPTALIFTRQGLPQQARTPEQLVALRKGGYVLIDSNGPPEAIVIATGSEVGIRRRSGQGTAGRGQTRAPGVHAVLRGLRFAARAVSRERVAGIVHAPARGRSGLHAVVVALRRLAGPRHGHRELRRLGQGPGPVQTFRSDCRRPQGAGRNSCLNPDSLIRNVRGFGRMAIKVGINGYGRIGRNILRALYEAKRTNEIQIVAVNDLGDAQTNAHLTQYDTAHGKFPGTVSVEGDSIVVNGDKIKVFAQRDPSKIDWASVGAEYVFESTGFFTTKADAGKHLAGGAKKVVISAPGGKDVDATVVYGVNHNVLKSSHTVISNASCTTNCLAPLAKVLNDKIGIVSGLMTTIHAYTNDQRLTDVYHEDIRRARSATMSMIPAKTGAAAAVGLVLPELKGKLDGFAIRIPTINVSLVDLTFVAKRATTVEEINKVVKEAADGAMKGVLAYTDKQLVSIDYNHDPASSTYDSTLTRVTEGTLVKVCSWYDNEWGFSNRMLDTTIAWSKAS